MYKIYAYLNTVIYFSEVYLTFLSGGQIKLPARDRTISKNVIANDVEGSCHD